MTTKQAAIERERIEISHTAAHAMVQSLAVVDEAKKLCEKFVQKVQDGRARSDETYNGCIDLLDMIKNLEDL